VRAPIPTQEPLLLTFVALHKHPELSFLADSELIHSGHRHRPGWCSAVRSLFFLHNETANIYTHLGGMLVVVWILRLVLAHPAEVGLVAGCALPVWPLIVFLCGAACCLLFSVLIHTFGTVSRATYAGLTVLDYIGISLLIFTSNVPAMRYAFLPEHPALWRLYFWLSLCVNLVAAVLGVAPFFRASSLRHLRALAYVLCGAVGAVPLLHLLWLSHGQRSGEGEVAWGLLKGTLGMGAQYVLGAALYGLRIPERWAPGRFDFFPSHSLFHILVVTAILTHWCTMRDLHNSRCSP
jgi:adiponectin receptor